MKTPNPALIYFFSWTKEAPGTKMFMRDKGYCIIDKEISREEYQEYYPNMNLEDTSFYYIGHFLLN